MTKKIILIIIILLEACYFLFFADKILKKSEIYVDTVSNLNKEIKVQIRDMTNVPLEYYSGDSRFSHGACQTDAECFNIGCSLEMCSADKKLLTTCEINGAAPDKTKYACGCIKDKCGWYFK